MKWNTAKSVNLSRICIFLFAIAGVVMAVIVPNYTISVKSGAIGQRVTVVHSLKTAWLITFYSFLVPAYLALWQLYSLLLRIEKNEVFTKKNVRALRIISWACYAAGIICLVSVSYYRPFIIIAAGAGFMGLIIRVVKNVFAQAILLKEENDATI